jgi:hypothetical protein
MFREERGISCCGLACVLCTEDVECPGCLSKIKGGYNCKTGKCALNKGFDGCYACPDYSCGDKMLQGKRKQAFIKYAQEFGKQSLIDRLRVNFENGIVYRTTDNENGDYDTLETIDEVYHLLRYGLYTNS